MQDKYIKLSKEMLQQRKITFVYPQ